MTPVLIMLNGAAIATSLAHVLIDVYIGLFGAGKTMPLAQALLVFVIAGLYGWWAAALAGAAQGERGLTLSLVLLSAVWVALGNGVAGLVGCAPICPNAAPYQDLTHIASLVVGAAAAYADWRLFREQSGPVRARFWVTAALFLIALVATQALTIRL